MAYSLRREEFHSVDHGGFMHGDHITPIRAVGCRCVVNPESETES